MTKKKSRARRYIRKNIVGVLKFVVTIVATAVVTIIVGLLTRPVIVINQTYTPPAAQAQWHDVQSWQIGVATTAITFDWAGFLGDVSWFVALGVAGLIGLYRWKKLNWKKYQGIVVTKPLLT